ncbi:MAG: ATP-binding cassette domain-containing protein [Methanomicrobiales archaeon]|nr:ATP-binding cassette domain-containing protein [Methanomicrobiales archaeon]
MKLVLDTIHARLGTWSLAAHGCFTEGIHLVSGDIGTGKSTLALLMAGLFPATSGSVTREQISSLMISFQFPEYHITGTTVNEECLSWGLEPGEILPALNLMHYGERDPFGVSRGELKRLHLACVLRRPYDLLILDEPFSSLDVREKQRVCNQIVSRKSAITILFTHEQTILPRVNHIWEICEGQLVHRGEVPGAIGRWQHAPPLITSLISAGKTPANLSVEDIREAACRI